MAGVLSRFSFATATVQQLKNSSNNENTVKRTDFWFSVWKKWCLEKGIAKEIENYDNSTPKSKTNMVQPRKRQSHFIEGDSNTD